MAIEEELAAPPAEDLPQGAWGDLPPAPSMVTLGLPPAPFGPEHVGLWYHEALQLPETRVTGWFGCAIGTGGADGDGDVQLFFYNGNHLEPTMRLVVSQADLMQIFAGLGKLLHERTPFLKEWNLRQI